MMLEEAAEYVKSGKGAAWGAVPRNAGGREVGAEIYILVMDQEEGEEPELWVEYSAGDFGSGIGESDSMPFGEIDIPEGLAFEPCVLTPREISELGGYDTDYTLEKLRGAPALQPAVEFAPVGRNAPCPCGSGRKYKQCHLLQRA